MRAAAQNLLDKGLQAKKEQGRKPCCLNVATLCPRNVGSIVV
ncbi:Uncharacterised protein [Afipia felis]|uniref:Uncharacterized protein n=2 Tax=Afipia felis TaxID=1035 RepID=A0A380W9I6_AFIFE|nr:hypothetical protein HMPREF9697_00567 [Afipia felis ATCC 53690]SUU76749.1 Uncharacterised protein [Afipia felis]SUU84815.1 Uncharacterised protein [Afipia felis]